MVNKTTHEILPGKVLDEYLEPEEVAEYHLNFMSGDKVEFDEFVFRFAGFSGNVSLGVYEDA